MYFNVSQLMREPTGSTRFHEVDQELAVRAETIEPTVYGEPVGLSHTSHPDGVRARITGQVRMLKTDRGIWVSALLKTEAKAVCSRCLEHFAHPLAAAIDEEFFQRGDDVPSGDYANENLTIDENNILDLAESVRQYFSLNSPMKPICRPECKGICSICGSNLNETTCRCDDTPVDLHWGALLDLAAAGRLTDSPRET